MNFMILTKFLFYLFISIISTYNEIPQNTTKMGGPCGGQPCDWLSHSYTFQTILVILAISALTAFIVIWKRRQRDCK